MKKVLAWVKGHLVLVVCLAIIVISLPAAYIFSSGWKSRVAQELQGRFDTDGRKVQGLDVNYAVPRFTPGGEAISVSAPPNAAYTREFTRIKREQLAEVERVVSEAEGFNRREHGAIVDGVFPRYADARAEQVKPFEFMRAMVGRAGEPGVVPTLMERVNAGMPPPPERVEARLQAARQSLLADLERSRGVGQPTPAEQQQIRQQLSERRIEQYQRVARSLGIYLEPATLQSALGLPDEVPSVAIPLPQMFQMQWKLWALTDLLDAVALANTDDRGRRMHIEDAVVKRIISIEFEPFDISTIAQADDFGGAAPTLSFGASGRFTGDLQSTDGLAPRNSQISITGRVTSPGNEVYDIRRIRLTAIMDSARIPRFVRSLGRTNFMSVLDMDVKSVDEWEAIGRGFSYGPGHVVEVSMVIETAWLRSWTVPLMPQRVREALGVPQDEMDRN